MPAPLSTIRNSNAIRYQNPQKYEVFYEVRLFNTGFEPEKVKIYQFSPVEWDTQKDITIEEISPLPTKQSMDHFGNGMYYWDMKKSPKIGESISFATRFTFTAYEIKASIDPADVQPYNTENPDNQLYTRSERFIEADDPEIIQLANQVAGTETNPYQIAHSFYDYIINTYHYEQTGRGLLGAKSFMETGKGECGDYTRCLLPFAVLRAFHHDQLLGIGPSLDLIKPMCGVKYILSRLVGFRLIQQLVNPRQHHVTIILEILTIVV